MATAYIDGDIRYEDIESAEPEKDEANVRARDTLGRCCDPRRWAADPTATLRALLACGGAAAAAGCARALLLPAPCARC
jgi:hypothetical protein